jgi:hypothetical protein
MAGRTKGLGIRSNWRVNCSIRVELSYMIKESGLFADLTHGAGGDLFDVRDGSCGQSQPRKAVLMATLIAIVDFLFGCHHLHLSRVFSLHGETYRVCCDCGAKFAYSLETMSIEHRLPLTPGLTQFPNCLKLKEHTESE